MTVAYPEPFIQTQRMLPSRARSTTLVFLFAAACGGSTVIIDGEPDGGAAPTVDGGAADVSSDVRTSARDAGTPDVVVIGFDAGCVDADITKLSAPDAALGTSGSIGLCTKCIKSECQSELGSCQDDCDCRESTVSVLACLAQSKPLTSCGTALVSSGATGQQLGLCVLNACNSACGGN